MLGKTHFYHEAIKRAVSVFGTMFNEIDIQRDKADGSTGQNVRVPLSYGPKQKFIARLDQAGDIMDAANSRVAMTLPRIAFDITGLTYDAERKLGKLKQYKLWFVCLIKEYRRCITDCRTNSTILYTRLYSYNDYSARH